MAVVFVVTGYSHFPGCPENPTESLVSRLELQLTQRMALHVAFEISCLSFANRS